MSSASAVGIGTGNVHSPEQLVGGADNGKSYSPSPKSSKLLVSTVAHCPIVPPLLVPSPGSPITFGIDE